MRIAVDARPLATPCSGIGRYTAAILEQLVSNGHHWFLYSSSPFDSPLSQRVNVTARVAGYAPQSPLGTAWLQLGFARWATRDNADVFWSPRHHLPLALSGDIASVVTIHDLVWRRYPKTMPSGARLQERLLMPAAVRRARKVIAVSRHTADEVVGLWPQAEHKCVVVHSGASTAGVPAHEMSTPAPQPFILFVGTPEPRKNLARLLRAYAGLRAAGIIGEKLVIVGADGWGGEPVRPMVDALGIGDDVVLRGRVDDGELNSLYARARCLALPSLYEGFGLPLVEAMQFGIPLVAAESGAMPEVAGDAALYCDPLSEDSIAAALARLLTEPDTHARLSRQSLARRSLFSWEAAAEQTLAVLMSAAGQGDDPRL